MTAKLSVVRVPAEVSAWKDHRGRVCEHVASVAGVEGRGRTPREAQARLALELHDLAADLRAPEVLWCLDGTAIVIYRDAHGWHYAFHRRVAGALEGGSRQGGTVSCATHEECVERAREHWYQYNVAPIILGILGLGGYGVFNCPRCAAAHYGWPAYTHWQGEGHREVRVYRCQNPACGHEVRS